MRTTVRTICLFICTITRHLPITASTVVMALCVTDMHRGPFQRELGRRRTWRIRR